MERFTITCQIAGKQEEIQFDVKKMPGEPGPSYMVSIDGMFRGYITKNRTGCFVQLNSDQLEDYMVIINDKLKRNTFIK